MGEKTILVIDDDKDIRDLINIYLENEGYIVLKAENGKMAMEILKNNDVDLIILDIMMPEMDGIEFCIKVRNSHHMPIIMLSAKTQDIDKISGLTSGADDYLTKPFNPLELVARVKSQLRRYLKWNAPQNMPESVEISINNLSINIATHEVKIGEREINLTPTEFAILELLARNRGIVFSIDRIYEKVWGDSAFETDHTVVVHIQNIRKKIEDNPRKPEYIKTVWGVGYKLEN
ncbi:response regulator transcription factor [Bacillus sp. S/N-304-OC-R1]|uniref:response regulator transcription factor n=1 Tax=Bacillus sp. S/N-304-OC-R1 TaxID=2758034 RepID=UPI001C8DC270|nr:response regulator transcription factor [Bacillus sp. S/N-304-OC-R1]MBY0122817.1 response regulator transcription factor [Bacillus sp. S/N-304-OC-R1]